MQYLKKALRACCRDCCTQRKDSNGSTQIILPSSRLVSSKDGTLVSKSTYTFLAQPDFYIPFKDEKMATTIMSPTTKRKQSAPPVMTRTIAIQPISAYATHDRMYTSLGEPQICIEEDTNLNNFNNNSFTSSASAWKSTESVSSLSPTHRLVNKKRLSVAQIAANHSRRSSMCSFDISKDDLDSDMYGINDLPIETNSGGKICFSFVYDSKFEQLIVSVISGQSLWNVEQSVAVTDSFVKIAILSGSKRKSVKMSTATQRDTSNPSYNEDFRFQNISIESLNSLAVQFTVYSVDGSSKKRKIGIVLHTLDDTIADMHDDTRQHIWKQIYADGVVSYFSNNNKLEIFSVKICGCK